VREAIFDLERAHRDRPSLSLPAAFAGLPAAIVALFLLLAPLSFCTHIRARGSWWFGGAFAFCISLPLMLNRHPRATCALLLREYLRAAYQFKLKKYAGFRCVFAGIDFSCAYLYYASIIAINISFHSFILCKGLSLFGVGAGPANSPWFPHKECDRYKYWPRVMASQFPRVSQYH